MLDIARLSERIRIEQLQNQKGSSGGVEQVWSPFVTVWASVEPTRGSERNIDARIEADSTHKVTVRADDVEGIGADMRIVLIDEGNRILDIESIQRIRERGWIVIIQARELEEATATEA